MKSKRIIICLFLFCSVSLFSQGKDWFTLARKDVTFKSETDVVNIRGDEKNVTHIKLKCTQGSLKFKGLVLVYKDKTVDKKKNKGTGLLTKGTDSFVFTVDKDKILDKVELSYDGIGKALLTKRAKIELLGRIK